MRTHLRESMLALLLIGILATGCDTGTKKASENSITFDSISVEKTYRDSSSPLISARIMSNYPPRRRYGNIPTTIWPLIRIWKRITRLRWRNPTRHRWALGSLTMRCRRMISPSTKTISSAIR